MASFPGYTIVSNGRFQINYNTTLQWYFAADNKLALVIGWFDIFIHTVQNVLFSAVDSIQILTFAFLFHTICCQFRSFALCVLYDPADDN